VKSALAIAAAEVRSLRLAFVGALLAGALGHLIVYRLGFRQAPGPEQAELIAFAVFICTQVGLGAVLGGSAVSRDLAERRLGFYLARPVPPLAYWGAKLAVAFAVAYTCGWLVLVPGFVVGPPATQLGAVLEMTRNFSGSALFGTAFVVALAAAATGAVRARSGLLLVDLVALLLTAAALLAVLVASWEGGSADVLLFRGLPWLRWVALPLLLAASAAQIALGRLDLRRGHVAASTVLWTGLLACVLGLNLFGAVVAKVTPEDVKLRPFAVEAPPAGDRVLFGGSDERWRGHVAAFFLDADGRFLPKRPAWDSGHAWSADGRYFVWSLGALPSFETPFWRAKPFQALPGTRPRLWAMDFAAPGAEPRLIARRPPGLERVRALSPDGTRVLGAGFRSKQVVAVGDGATLATIPDPATWSMARFLSGNAVRALRRDSEHARIVDWDVASGRLVERGAIRFEGDRGEGRSIIPTHDWQRVLRVDDAGLFLHDLDGRLLATLVNGWPATPKSRYAFHRAGLLSEDRFGSIERGAEGFRLRVFDREGRALLETQVQASSVGGESEPGVLVLGRGKSWSPDGTIRFRGESEFVELATGKVLRRENGVWPAFNAWPVWGGSVEPGSVATRVFFTTDDALVRLDPVTGARTVLVRRRAS
jgi:hypothetical protein